MLTCTFKVTYNGSQSTKRRRRASHGIKTVRRRKHRKVLNRRKRRKTKQYGHSKRQRSTAFSRAIIRLKKLKAPQQRQAISMANNAFIRQIVNHVKRLKHKKLPLRIAKAFRKHRKQIRRLVNPRTSWLKRRAFSTERGGGTLFYFLKILPVVVDAINLVESL